MSTKNHIEFSDGRIYTGEVLYGKMHGTGTLIWPKGNECLKYVGKFKDDKRDGPGTFIWMEDGECVRYVGEWKDDKMHHGTMIWADGIKYEGEWKDGKVHWKKEPSC